MVESEDKAPKPALDPVTGKPILRDPRGKFLKGSGTLNPKGRPKGTSFLSRLRMATNDSQSAIDLIVGYVDGTIPCSAHDRLEAAKWIVDRTEGKALDRTVSLTATQAEDALRDLTLDEIKTLARLPPLPTNEPTPIEEGELIPSDSQEEDS